MANESSTIVQKLWNHCNVLRDDGVSYKVSVMKFSPFYNQQSELEKSLLVPDFPTQIKR
jgi:hypothetical protein